MAHAPWELVHKALQEGSALLQGISIRQSSLTPTTAAMGLGVFGGKRSSTVRWAGTCLEPW